MSAEATTIGGCVVMDNFVTTAFCAGLLARVYDYRCRYTDRNAVTAILYLNATRGGETECYPNYRLSLARAAHSNLQQKLDRVLQNRFVRFLAPTQLLVRPRAGRLLIMEGNRCLHSVRPVLGRFDRINIVMSYDRPHARFEVDDNLNRYLYSATETNVADPNYLLKSRA